MQQALSASEGRQQHGGGGAENPGPPSCASLGTWRHFKSTGWCEKLSLLTTPDTCPRAFTVCRRNPQRYRMGEEAVSLALHPRFMTLQVTPAASWGIRSALERPVFAFGVPSADNAIPISPGRFQPCAVLRAPVGWHPLQADRPDAPCWVTSLGTTHPPSSHHCTDSRAGLIQQGSLSPARLRQRSYLVTSNPQCGVQGLG